MLVSLLWCKWGESMKHIWLCFFIFILLQNCATLVSLTNVLRLFMLSTSTSCQELLQRPWKKKSKRPQHLLCYAKILQRLILNRYTYKHKAEYVINHTSFVDTRTAKKQNFVNSLYLQAANLKMYQWPCAHYCHLILTPDFPLETFIARWILPWFFVFREVLWAVACIVCSDQYCWVIGLEDWIRSETQMEWELQRK